MNQWPKLARLLGFAGSAMGLFAGLALGSIRSGLINVNPGVEPRPGPSVELLGNFGFLFACTIPFALALVAWRLDHPAHRVSIWLGIALLAFVVALSPLSIATCLLLPLPALLLGLAAALTLREDWCHLQVGHAPRALAVLNNLVVGLVLRQGKHNLPEARRHYAAHLEEALTTRTSLVDIGARWGYTWAISPPGGYGRRKELAHARPKWSSKKVHGLFDGSLPHARACARSETSPAPPRRTPARHREHA